MWFLAQVQLESKPEAIDVLERQLIRLQVGATPARCACCACFA